MALAAEEALVKINAVLPTDLKAQVDAVNIHAMNAGTISPETKLFIDQLDKHIDDKMRLRIAYTDLHEQQTSRTVWPLGLWFWGKVWTLVTWCELRNDFRIFRLDRILSFETQGHFRPEPGKSLATFYSREAAKHASRTEDCSYEKDGS